MSMDVSLRHDNSQLDESSSVKQSAEKLIDSSVDGNISSQLAAQEPDTTTKLKTSPSDTKEDFVNAESDEHHNGKVGITSQLELEESVILTDKLTTFSEHASRDFSESICGKENKCELEFQAQTQVEETGTKGLSISSDNLIACSENISSNFTKNILGEEYKHELEIPQSTLEAFGKKGSLISENSPSKVFEDEATIFTGKHMETSLDDAKVSSTSKKMGLQEESMVCELHHDNLGSPLVEAESPNREHSKPTVENITENGSNTEVGEGDISPLIKCDALESPRKTDTTDATESSNHQHSKPTVTDASEIVSKAGVGDKEMSSSAEGDALDLPQTDLSNATLVHLSSPPCDEKNANLLLPSEEAAIGSSGQPEIKEEGTPIGSRKRRKPTVKTTAVSARVLRSRLKDKPEAPLSCNVAEEVPDAVEKKQKRKRKQMKKTPVSEFSRMRNHLRYLLHRIKVEQNLIDAYSSEGWRKQSLEKIKPEKELQKAKSHILRYKLKIRDLFQRLDLSLTEGQIPESLFDSEGEIDSEDIFCAKCGSKDVSLDNDIILCDGSCERGFHQFCLEPRLKKEDIPQGDEGWLCPGCDCKVDCIDLLNDFNGVKLSVLDSWEKVFPEANAAAMGKTLEDGSALPSDDSEDDDYDPDRAEVNDELADQETSSDESDDLSASNDTSGSPAKPGFSTKEHFMGLPSEDSEDDDFDPDAPDDDDHDDDKVKESSSDFTSDSEDLGALLQDNTSTGDDQGHSNHVGEELRVGVRGNRQSLKDEVSHLLNSNESPISSKRHVERLDYKKLHDETYGNESSDSSDEDFEENVGRKRKKNISGTISGKGSASAGNESDIRPEDGDQEERSAKQANKQFYTEHVNANLASHPSSSEAGSSKRHRSKPHQKLGEAVTKRLFESFKQEQYPKRPEKENLARDLGLTIQQVAKWFENARWSFRHSASMRSSGTSGSSRGQKTKAKLKNKGQVVDTEVVLGNVNNIVSLPVTNLGAELSKNVDVVVGPLITEEPSKQKYVAQKSRKRKNKGDQPPSSCEKTFEGNSQVDSPDSQRVRRSSRLQQSTGNAVA